MLVWKRSKGASLWGCVVWCMLLGPRTANAPLGGGCGAGAPRFRRRPCVGCGGGSGVVVV